MARHIDLKPLEDEAPGQVAEVVDEGKDGSPWVPSRARCGGLWLHWTGWKMNAVIPHFVGQWFTVLNGSTYYASHPGTAEKTIYGGYFNASPLFGQELVYHYSEERLVRELRAATLVRLVKLLAKEGVIGRVKQEERRSETEAAYHLQRQQAMQRIMELGANRPYTEVQPWGTPPESRRLYRVPATVDENFIGGQYNGISRVEPELAQARTTEEVLSYWRPRLDSESIAMVHGLVARSRSHAPDSSWMSIPELELLSRLSLGEVSQRIYYLSRSPVNLVEVHPSEMMLRARRDTLFLDRPQTYEYQYRYTSPRYFYHPPYTSGVAVPSGTTQEELARTVLPGESIALAGEGAERQAIIQEQQAIADAEQASGEIDIESSSG